MSAFNFATAADKKTYSADFSILALVKDGNGEVVQSVSQQYPLTGTIDSLESARKEQLLFYRETQLPAGSYTVELIAHDELTGKTSLQTSSLNVPCASVAFPNA